jgi:hypothetical protein
MCAIQRSATTDGLKPQGLIATTPSREAMQMLQSITTELKSQVFFKIS